MQIYVGAPNVHAFIPGPRSFVHARDFGSAEELWRFVSYFEQDTPETAARYADFFTWKAAARNTMMMDEEGQAAPLGTGRGLVRDVMALPLLVEELQRWDAKLNLRPASAQDVVVALEAEVRRLEGYKSFESVAMYAWRHFRRQLDRCVHYAECRICELVSLLT